LCGAEAAGAFVADEVAYLTCRRCAAVLSAIAAHRREASPLPDGATVAHLVRLFDLSTGGAQ
jgi:hypothetical protein